ncbi:5-formyltetrahydrofolate cyclo-ligase [Blattabacterium cuenoti]|uniref:5-formyltetrahydrofolate cyclo-ligase n=1 Tax=Blattabacterium cuenoti TaxID=1653831 RepID=UPI00163CF261|nr:5-formyltetrahydrofolate cyclo-ligase [Blattabacterium cuenoti]
MNKKELRNKYLSYRKSLSKKEIFKKSYKIFFQLKKLSIWDKKYYHIFLPIQEHNEINTFIIINFLLKRKKYVTIPYSNFHLLSIENCSFDKNTILEENQYGILEPKKKHIISTNLIEVIFIPLLIFDLKGYRIGYGKGFYDRFLMLCNKNILKIGLSFFNPVKKIHFLHKNDLTLDIGITGKKSFFFKNSIKKYF